MQKLLLLLLFLPILLPAQMTQKDSIDYTFKLRDSIEVVYNERRTMGSEDFDMNSVWRYYDQWHFLNFRLKCWKSKVPFSYERYMYDKSRTLYQYDNWAYLIREWKIERWEN